MASRDSVQKKLETLVTQATIRNEKTSLVEPDWTTNFTIVDSVNKSPDVLGKMLAEVIAAHLKKQKSNPKAVLLTLILLEACIKNCGAQFHTQICDPHFVERLLKTGGARIAKPQKALPKTFTSAKELAQSRVEEKVCGLIQWMGPLHPDKLRIYNDAFEKLKKKGVQFPEPKPEDHAPLSTDERNKKMRESIDEVDIPKEIRTQLTELKQTITLLEGMVSAAQTKEDLTGEVLVELVDRIKQAQPKLEQWMTEAANSQKERLVDIIIRTTEKSVSVLEKYDHKKLHGTNAPQPKLEEAKQDADSDNDLISFDDIFETPSPPPVASDSNWNPFSTQGQDPHQNQNQSSLLSNPFVSQPSQPSMSNPFPPAQTPNPNPFPTNFDWFTNMPSPSPHQPSFKPQISESTSDLMNWIMK